MLAWQEEKEMEDVIIEMRNVASDAPEQSLTMKEALSETCNVRPGVIRGNSERPATIKA